MRGAVRASVLTVGAVVACASLLAAQENRAAAEVEAAHVWRSGDDWSWTVRRDTGSSGDPIRIQQEGEGWIMQTGASSILFRAEQRLTPPYRIEVEFEGTDPMRRNEGYGIVFGGSELDGAQQSYGYVLVRQDGMLLVKGREGDRTYIERDWHRVQALQAWADRPTGADVVVNELVLDVTDARLRVVVNGHEVAEIATDRLPVDGLVGLRVNHGLRIGVRRFEVSGR